MLAKRSNLREGIHFAVWKRGLSVFRVVLATIIVLTGAYDLMDVLELCNFKHEDVTVAMVSGDHRPFSIFEHSRNGTIVNFQTTQLGKDTQVDWSNAQVGNDKLIEQSTVRVGNEKLVD